MDDTDTDAPEAAARTTVTRKQFVARAIERSGHRNKSEAKAVVEATLATLGEALLEGEFLQIPPLGRLHVARDKDGPRGRVLNLRLAIPKADKGDASADLAAAPEAE